MARIILILGFIFALGAASSAWADALDDGNAGIAAADNGNYDLTIHYFTKAIQSGEFSDDNLVAAFNNRGIAYDDKGQYDRAIRDYDEALRVDPDRSDARTRRGRAYFYLARFAEAAADLARAVKAAPEDHFNVLWLALAEARAGRGGRVALERNAKRLDLKKWPGPVVRLYLGDASRDSVLTAAKNSDPKRRKEKQCEANFYLGQLALLDDNTNETRRQFKAAVNTGVTNFIEYSAAKAELAPLK